MRGVQHASAMAIKVHVQELSQGKHCRARTIHWQLLTLTRWLCLSSWQEFGWPAVFVIYGSLGLFWNLAWQKLVADYPPLLPAVPQNKAQLAATAAAMQQQQAVIQQQQGVLQQPAAPQQPQQQQAAGRLPPLPRVQDLPWKQFFTNKAFLAIVMAHSAFGKYPCSQLAAAAQVQHVEYMYGVPSMHAGKTMSARPAAGRCDCKAREGNSE